MSKFLKITLFIGSAVLLAFITSYFVNKNDSGLNLSSTKNIEKTEEENINKYNDLLIDGELPIKDIIENDNDVIIEEDNNRNKDSYIYEETEDIDSGIEYNVKKEEDEESDYYLSNIKSSQGSNIKNNKNIEEEDLNFLEELVEIADAVTDSYSLLLTYALDGDFLNGLNNIFLLEENYEQLKAIETKNKSLKNIKEEYLKGIENYILGFKAYFNYQEDSNDYFYESDDNFYNAQIKLEAFLNNYK